MEKIIRIGIAEDHVLFRKALINLIHQFENCKVILEAGNGSELKLEMQKGDFPDVILLDLCMPVMNGYETLEWLQKHHPALKTIILSMYGSDFNIIRLIRMGARAFLNKDINPEELKFAIYSVEQKGFYHTSNITRKLLGVLYNDSNSEFEFKDYTLSEKEIFFLQLVSTSLTYKEIAQKMCLSPRGVDKIRDRLFYKLHAKNRAELAIKAVDHGIANWS